MKIAVSSYSFSQAFSDGRMNLFDVIPAAKRMGFEGVEIVRGNETDEDMRLIAPYLKSQSKKYGVAICAYLTSADFLKNGLEHEIGRLCREAEFAALMGAPRMRHDSSAGYDAEGNAVSFEDALPILTEGYRRVTEFAAGLGVKTMIENHGYFMQDSLRVKKLIETVNHSNFGWLTDIGNFLCADEDPVSAMKNSAPYTVHAHAKDFHYKKKGDFIPKAGYFPTRNGNSLCGAMIGHGIVDVPACLSLLKESGYDGWLSVEFEGLEDCLFAIEEGAKNLRAILESI